MWPYRGRFIYKLFGDDEWVTTHRFPLGDSDVLRSVCFQSDRIYGCRFPWSSRFAVLDIDAGGRYHSPEQIKLLQGALEASGITSFTVYRSSDSGGYHLYIPFDSEIRADDLNWGLTAIVRDFGFIPSKGNLEIYPPRDVDSQALRLPLQHGWAFLNQQTLETCSERYELSPGQAINWFLSDLELTNQSTKFLQYIEMLEVLNYRKEDYYDDFEPQTIIPESDRCTPYNGCANVIDLVFRLNDERWQQGKQYWQCGLTGVSQRHEALFCVGYYLFFGDEAAGVPALGYGWGYERAELMRDWLSKCHNGFSDEVNQSKRDAFEQIERMCNWLPVGKRGSGLMKQESSYERANRVRAEAAQAKIAEWVEKLKDVGVGSQNEFQRLTGMSIHTVRKYRHLWAHLLDVKPQQEPVLIASIGVLKSDTTVPEISTLASEFRRIIFRETVVGDSNSTSVKEFPLDTS